MSWSPEENSFAAEFLRRVQYGIPTVLHDPKQLEHVETQIGKVQAGLTGESDAAKIEYDIPKQVGVMKFGERRIQKLDKQFLAGMINTARYLRRNIR